MAAGKAVPGGRAFGVDAEVGPDDEALEELRRHVGADDQQDRHDGEQDPAADQRDEPDDGGGDRQ